MKIRNLVLVGLLSVAPALVRAQTQQAVPRREARQALEAQIFNRFLDRVSGSMVLDASGREKLREHLQESGQRRRHLAQRAVALRRELTQAMYNANTPDETFTRIVNDLAQLRRDEQKLWDADQEALSRTLTPRQQAIFLLEWTRFQDRIREIATQRPGGPPRRAP